MDTVFHTTPLGVVVRSGSTGGFSTATSFLEQNTSLQTANITRPGHPLLRHADWRSQGHVSLAETYAGGVSLVQGIIRFYGCPMTYLIDLSSFPIFLEELFNLRVCDSHL
ncbi:hypothetical protein [Novosphingobium nitrogenifigens]|nr:hypothetical protein [Novosphingobium nitrogenifigens]